MTSLIECSEYPFCVESNKKIYCIDDHIITSHLVVPEGCGLCGPTLRELWLALVLL